MYLLPWFVAFIMLWYVAYVHYGYKLMVIYDYFSVASTFIVPSLSVAGG